MAASPEYLEYLKDLLADFGPVTARRMFGGAGLFRDGVMFGLVADDTLYLKADERNRPDFEAAGMPPFTYARGDRDFSMSYYLAPPDVVEDADGLAAWARKAFDAALAGRKTKSGGKQKP